MTFREEGKMGGILLPWRKCHKGDFMLEEGFPGTRDRKGHMGGKGIHKRQRKGRREEPLMTEMPLKSGSLLPDSRLKEGRGEEAGAGLLDEEAGSLAPSVMETQTKKRPENRHLQKGKGGGDVEGRGAGSPL